LEETHFAQFIFPKTSLNKSKYYRFLCSRIDFHWFFLEIHWFFLENNRCFIKKTPLIFDYWFLKTLGTSTTLLSQKPPKVPVFF